MEESRTRFMVFIIVLVVLAITLLMAEIFGTYFYHQRPPSATSVRSNASQVLCEYYVRSLPILARRTFREVFNNACG